MNTDSPRRISLLDQHAGPRTRTVDDHMFAADPGFPGGNRGTFRLQLFIGRGLRPVAIATQGLGEGTSLVNAAEEYAQAVWQRHCPDEAEPPIFIIRMLDVDYYEYHHIGFTVVSRFVVDTAKFGPALRRDDVATLVGGPVDPDRGEGFVPRPKPVAGQRTYFNIIQVAQLPIPDLRGEPECMSQTSPRPVQLPAGCCPYHSVDWNTVSALVVQALQQAWKRHGRDASTGTLRSAVYHLMHAEGLDQTTLGWAASLVNYPILPVLNRGTYINGRHRARAMIDARVPETIIEAWQM